MIGVPSLPGRILALDPTSAGVGFVVIEGSERLVDWGVRRVVRHSEASYRAVVYALIDRLRPDTIVTERNTGSGCRRRLQARLNIDATQDIAGERRIPFRQYSTRQIGAVFAQWNALTKEKRADLLTTNFPALASCRPPQRKAWMSEDRRMAIFDALAFALTHIFIEAKKESALQSILF